MALSEEFEKQGNFLFKYRSYFPIAFFLISIPVFGMEVLQGNELLNDQKYWFMCLLVGILGLLIRVFTVGYTPANTSGRNTADGQLADELNETGFYSLVRHPLYLGNYFMWLAVAMLTANLWFIFAFTFLYWLYYERIMYAEEAFLRKKFKEYYLTWAAGRPAFVPALKIPVKPKYSFSLKKVLKKEKNGVAALFGLFWIFDLTKNFIETGVFTIQNNFWVQAFVVSGLLYFILKMIKKYTSILEEAGR